MNIKCGFIFCHHSGFVGAHTCPAANGKGKPIRVGIGCSRRGEIEGQQQSDTIQEQVESPDVHVGTPLLLWMTCPLCRPKMNPIEHVII